MPSQSKALRVGITMGDPAGVGPHLINRGLLPVRHLARFIVIGDKGVYSLTQKPRTGIPIEFIDLSNVRLSTFRFGKKSSHYGKASLEYINKAITLLKDRQIDCLVTCPVSKETISASGIPFHGHTEYLANSTRTQRYVMMLLNHTLKFSLVTRHLPLKNVPGEIKVKTIQESICITHQYLKSYFGLRQPRIVVCALNPHASDNGLMGEEENSIIRPAVHVLQKKLPAITGPLPADTAISLAAKKEFDCIIALYHDQALIPLKLTEASENGVNITLGLPFVRTSPLHGTAFDIAHRPSRINTHSFTEAVKLAIQCTQNLKRN
jgi:4-hydroxythreonine-4-phosphate dehydrogenase